MQSSKALLKSEQEPSYSDSPKPETLLWADLSFGVTASVQCLQPLLQVYPAVKQAPEAGIRQTQ